MAQPDWLKAVIAKTNHSSKPAVTPSAPRKRYRGKKHPIAGCACTACRKLKEKISSVRGDPMENAGAVQHNALERGWSMGTNDKENGGKWFGHLTDLDMADREEREAYGKPLSAAYWTMLGPTPKCRAGDTKTAKIFVQKIQRAIDYGRDGQEEWSTSEWARLYRMRKKWQRRANGLDARFMVVGNMGGTPEAAQRADIKLRQQIQGMLETARGKKG